MWTDQPSVALPQHLTPSPSAPAPVPSPRASWDFTDESRKKENEELRCKMKSVMTKHYAYDLFHVCPYRVMY